MTDENTEYPAMNRDARFVFEIVFADYAYEDDLQNEENEGHVFALELEASHTLPGIPRLYAMEHEALKETMRLLGVDHVLNEGHDAYGALLLEIPVDTLEHVVAIWDKVQSVYGGGDDTIYLDVPYFEARGFTLYPLGYNGPSFGTGGEGDLADWIEAQ